MIHSTDQPFLDGVSSLNGASGTDDAPMGASPANAEVEARPASGEVVDAMPAGPVPAADQPEDICAAAAPSATHSAMTPAGGHQPGRRSGSAQGRGSNLVPHSDAAHRLRQRRGRETVGGAR